LPSPSASPSSPPTHAAAVGRRRIPVHRESDESAQATDDPSSRPPPHNSSEEDADYGDDGGGGGAVLESPSQSFARDAHRSRDEHKHPEVHHSPPSLSPAGRTTADAPAAGAARKGPVRRVLASAFVSASADVRRRLGIHAPTIDLCDDDEEASSPPPSSSSVARSGAVPPSRAAVTAAAASAATTAAPPRSRSVQEIGDSSDDEDGEEEDGGAAAASRENRKRKRQHMDHAQSPERRVLRARQESPRRLAGLRPLPPSSSYRRSVGGAAAARSSFVGVVSVGGRGAVPSVPRSRWSCLCGASSFVLESDLLAHMERCVLVNDDRDPHPRW
jgi:hypothetical protein